MEEALVHLPVLFDEAIEALAIDPAGIYVDCTFGRGGHSREILRRLGREGRLLAIDRDPRAAAFARQMQKGDPRFEVLEGPFSQLPAWLAERGLLGRVNGLLLDLGVSSPQLDDAGRGFSFLRDGPLDMRMTPSVGVSAAAWLAAASEREVAETLRVFGEESHAKRIARAIVAARAEAPIATTLRLAEVIAKASPQRERGKHPATKSFQAIRIRINGELEELRGLLDSVLEILAPGGRLAVISFHSLEDRMVKRFIREHSLGDSFPKGIPVTQDRVRPLLRRVGGSRRAGLAESERNPRARSAVLRVAERLP